MSKVAVQEASTGGKLGPVLKEFRKRFEAIRQRAHDFFEQRRQHGSALEDWLKAERELLGSPAAELAESVKTYRAEVALPGFDAKDVSVIVTPHEIVVHALRNEERREKDENVLWTEFGSSEVYRRLETPEPIDTEKTTAALDKGLLRIVAPKIEGKPVE